MECLDRQSEYFESNAEGLPLRWGGFIPVLGLLLAVVLVACGSDREDVSSFTTLPLNPSALPLPGDAIRVLSLIPEAYVEIEVWREGELEAVKILRVDVDPNTSVVSPFKLTLPLGAQTLWINQFIVDPFYGRVNIAQTERNTINVSGQASIDFSAIGLVFPLPDVDGDNVPNVIELVDRTDPNNNLDKSVPAGAVQLRSLAITGVTLTPNFDPGSTYYRATVAVTDQQVRVTAQLAGGNATLVINDKPVDSGVTQELAIPSRGVLRVKLKVNAGTEEAVYYLDIDRQSIVLEVKPWDRSADLTWSGAAAEYNVYHYTGTTCDVRDYTRCPDGAMFSNQTSPFTATGLTNGKVYSFQVEALFPDHLKTYTPVALARPERAVLDNGVEAIAIADDGTAYVGGSFSRAIVAPTYGAAMHAVTGQPDVDYALINGPVNAVVSDGVGGWYIGGEFTRVGTMARFGLAHVLANNEVDANWSPAVGEGPPMVKALALEGEVLVVGGLFTRIGDMARRNLAAVSTAGVVLPWNESGADDEVSALAVSNGVVYVGGRFRNLAGRPRICLGAVSLTDGNNTTWRADAAMSEKDFCYVNALVVMGDTVYVGGGFNVLGGENRTGLAAVSTQGPVQPWHPVLKNNEPFGDFSAAINGIAIQGDTAFVAGNFQWVGDTAREGLAAISLDNATLIREWAPKVNTYQVYRILISNNTLFIAGSFSYIISQGRIEERQGVAAIGLNGEILPWNMPSVVSYVRALAIDDDRIFVGGSRMEFYDKPRLHLAAFSPEGNLLPWAPSVEQSGNPYINPVYEIEVIGETVYIGGTFDRVAGEPRRNLAAITRDGSVTGFNPQVDGTVLALASAKNRLFVGGNFSTIDGSARPRLAAFSGEVLETGWVPVIQDFVDIQAGSAYVSEIEILGDTVYAGGYFNSGTMDSQSNLAVINGSTGALRARTSEWPQFGPIRAMAITADTLVVDSAYGFIALELNGQTTLWTLPISDSLSALLERGNVLFIAENGRGLRTVRAQTGADLAWRLKLDGPIYALAAFGDTLYVGGNFQSIDDQLTGSLALLSRFKLPQP